METIPWPRPMNHRRPHDRRDRCLLSAGNQVTGVCSDWKKVVAP
jgi:hypothetical protein